MPEPVTLPWKIYEGDTFEYPFRIREKNGGPYVDLTGDTPKCQMRKPDGTLILEVDVVLLDQVTTPGGVLISIDKEDTAGMFVTAGSTAKSDFELTTAAGKRRTFLVFSPITITPETTKP